MSMERKDSTEREGGRRRSSSLVFLDGITKDDNSYFVLRYVEHKVLVKGVDKDEKKKEKEDARERERERERGKARWMIITICICRPNLSVMRVSNIQQ